MRSRSTPISWAHRTFASLLVCGLIACGEHGPSRPGVGIGIDGGVLGPDAPDAFVVLPDGAIDAPDQPTAEPSPSQRRDLYIVAHQDDDLGLMSPDLLSRVTSGDPVRTVYLTSGDAGLDCDTYVAARELGVKVAYAMMAGVANEWDQRELELLGKVVRVARLRGTEIELLFLGFHNGGYTFETPDLELLWGGGAPNISTRTLDGRSRADTYTRTELIAVLRQILIDWAPTHIQTLDSGRLQPLLWPFDHSDHVHSALFALAAVLQYDGSYSLSMYRAYNDMFEQPNVSASAARRKQEVFEAYLEHDPKICAGFSTVLCGRVTDCDLPDFYTDFSRQYRTVVYEKVSGVLRGPNGSCASGDSDGSARLAACERDNPRQRFELSADRRVRHMASGLCLDAGLSRRGAVLTLAPCNDRVQQRFLLTTQRQLRGPDGTCVQNEGGAMVLRECTLEAAQLDWTPGMYPNFVTATIAGLGNWELPDDVAVYGSLSYGDVEGDGDDDVCMRRSDGVYCAFAEHPASFTAFTRVLAGFRDDQGWSAPAYGATVQLGDIDGDGADELCGRAGDGVWCADWDPTLEAFDVPTRRSHDFGDAQGYALDASRYGSLRIVDLDGDRMGDLCARSEQGLRCARSMGGQFAPPVSWTNDQFTDALGWGSAPYGSTLRYGDVDGDGDADVCGRAREGILCARNDGRRFVDPHLWSHTGDFSDGNGWNARPSYFDSIRLTDIDRDGDADVCGRGPDGLLCGISIGAAFTAVNSLGAADAFSDRGGWQPDRYGSTLGLIDLNLDGFADLCAWGPDYDAHVGLNCAIAN